MSSPSLPNLFPGTRRPPLIRALHTIQSTKADLPRGRGRSKSHRRARLASSSAVLGPMLPRAETPVASSELLPFQAESHFTSPHLNHTSHANVAPFRLRLPLAASPTSRIPRLSRPVKRPTPMPSLAGPTSTGPKPRERHLGRERSPRGADTLHSQLHIHHYFRALSTLTTLLRPKPTPMSWSKPRAHRGQSRPLHCPRRAREG